MLSSIDALQLPWDEVWRSFSLLLSWTDFFHELGQKLIVSKRECSEDVTRK